MKHALLLYVISILQSLKGVLPNEEESMDVYRILPSGDTVLANVLREQTPASEISGLTPPPVVNCLSLFLGRFQPALDRESKKLEDRRKEMMSRRKKRKDGMTQVCTKVPGRVICKFGRYTYVVNTKDKELNDDEVEKVVGMMHQRVSDGDKSFEISVVGPKEKCVLSTVVSGQGLDQIRKDGVDESPIVVECTPVERKWGSSNDVRETVFSCRTLPLKLKKREVVSKVVAMTCPTPLSVRRFTDICPTPLPWCPCTTFKPCYSTCLPPCFPWCNPFLKLPPSPQT